MIRVVAKFNLKPEAKEQAMALFEELVSKTRKEEGCGGYDLAAAADNGNQMVVLEAWESKEALDVHSASEHFTRLVPQLVALCTEQPSIDSFVQVI